MDEFRLFFRMSRTTFEVIARTFLQEYQRVRSSGESPVTVETIFLWYVGSLEPLSRIADRYSMTQFSALNIRKSVKYFVNI